MTITATVTIERPATGTYPGLGDHEFVALPAVGDTIDLGNTVGEVRIKSILHTPGTPPPVTLYVEP